MFLVQISKAMPWDTHKPEPNFFRPLNMSLSFSFFLGKSVFAKLPRASTKLDHVGHTCSLLINHLQWVRTATSRVLHTYLPLHQSSVMGWCGYKQSLDLCGCKLHLYMPRAPCGLTRALLNVITHYNYSRIPSQLFYHHRRKRMYTTRLWEFCPEVIHMASPKPNGCSSGWECFCSPMGEH